MTPPRKVRVGPRTYDIKLVPHIEAESGVTGLCGNDTLILLIDSNQADDGIKDTLLHEVGHAMFHLAGLGKDFGGAIKSEDEERILRVLTPHFLDLLQRNPKLVEYLTEKS